MAFMSTTTGDEVTTIELMTTHLNRETYRSPVIKARGACFPTVQVVQVYSWHTQTA